jgi:hypothetical protein
MRGVLCLGLVVVPLLGHAQQGALQVAGKRVELGEPKAVAVGVTEAFWKPDGRAIAFYADDADGHYLGVFDQDSGKAKDLLRLAPGMQIHYEAWLPQRPIYLVVTSRPVAGRAARRWSVTALDAAAMTSRDVWSAEYGAEEEIGIEVDASPSLDHAIVTVTDSTGRVPVVVLNGATNAVLSRDLALAWEQGAEFAGWSADGTAYFTAPKPAPTANELTTILTQQQGGVVELQLKVSAEETLSSVPIIGFLLKFKPTAPEAGTPVYELMPGNAALRPVLSRGPYVGPKTWPHVVYPVSEETVAVSRDRRDGTGALWLVHLTGEEGDPYGKDGLLIATSASRFWMCDDGNWIAYESGGALFVRRISYGGGPFSGELTKAGD